MNFSYEELSKLKFAAQKLLEAVHQIEAVNITTGGNDILVPESFLDALLDDVELCLRFKDKSLLVCKIDRIKPIETPEEKVQREQEEFVASFNSEKYSNPTLYREGLRDAYRKLKGGE